MILLDHMRRWFGTPSNPINVKVVGSAGNTQSPEGTQNVEVTNWPVTQHTAERPFRILGYGYVEVNSDQPEATLDPQGRIFTLRNMDLDTTVYFALEPGKMDEGIPILPRNATRGYVHDGPVYIYANTTDPVRIYYLYAESGV